MESEADAHGRSGPAQKLRNPAGEHGKDPPMSFLDIRKQELDSLRPGWTGSAAATSGLKVDQCIDRLSPPLAALCLSGGGIRSASFALGLIQGLARFRVLKHFDYLSTVSGGGYTGSFVSAWRTHLGGDEEPQSDEKLCAALDRPGHEDGREAKEIRGLRKFSNYLTPRLGALSADTWTLVALVIRNLLLNWAVFLPLFMGVLLTPRLCAALLAYLAAPPAFPPGPFFAAGTVAAATGFAFASFGRQFASGKWLTDARFVGVVVLPLVVASIFYTIGIACAASRASLEPNWFIYGPVIGCACYLFAGLLGTAAYRFAALGRQYDDRAKLIEQVWDVAAWGLSGAAVGLFMVIGIWFVETKPGQIVAGIIEIDRAYPLMAIGGICLTMLAVLSGELLFVGLRSYSARGDMDREWLARSAGWLAAIAAGWAVFAAAALLGPQLFDLACHHIGLSGTMVASALPGAVSVLIGNSAKTPAQADAAPAGRFSFLQIASLAALVFAALLAILVSTLDRTVERAIEPHFSPGRRALLDFGLQALLIGVSVLFSCLINVNRFSLHAVYRNRLVRAYLGSARAFSDARAGRDKNRRRNADPFTDFDQNDNVRMKDLPKRKLLHVLNTTLNVTATKNLAWQQRKAEPFTITPLSCGNPNVCYRPSEQFASSTGGVTLGTAMAISGAAVSPNMGSHSSPLVCFLLMLTNLRLGWWLGNPRHDKYMKEGPNPSIVAMLKELAGHTTDDGSWIYLSDGGHFDNIGLYEMVRRRCRLIVVSDAGEDPECSLSDLGDCLRKIYIDLGISIDFEDFEIKKRQDPPVPGKYFAIARITYPHTPEDVEPGWLLYVKTNYHGDERTDIRSYATAHALFPNESTADQWFSESQIESYRALGAHIMEFICSGGQKLQPNKPPTPIDLATFKQRAQQALGARPAQPGAEHVKCGVVIF